MENFRLYLSHLKMLRGLTLRQHYTDLLRLLAEKPKDFILLDSKKLTVNEKERYKTLIRLDNGRYSMDVNILASALRLLSELLYKHYGKKTIIIIDEYDVPLDKAFQNGYYREMVSLIRAMFGDALKTNDFYSLPF